MKLPKLPSPLAVGSITYTVRYEPQLTAVTGTNGVCGQDVQSILIDDQLGDDQRRETVIHEALHGVFHDSSLHALFEKLQKTTSDEDLEETVILELSKRLMALLRDNPHLVDFLLAE